MPSEFNDDICGTKKVATDLDFRMKDVPSLVKEVGEFEASRLVKMLNEVLHERIRLLPWVKTKEAAGFLIELRYPIHRGSA